MEKSFSKANLLWWTLIFIFFTNCSKNKPDIISNDENIKGHLVETDKSDMLSIYEIDSLFMQYPALDKEIKSAMTRNSILIVRFYSTKNLYHFVVTDRNIPYSLQNQYKIYDYGSKKIILESNIPLISKPYSDTVLNKLIKNGLITLKNKDTQENISFFEFVVCKKDSSKSIVFDNIMADDSAIVYMEKGLIYKDSIFHPKCN